MKKTFAVLIQFLAFLFLFAVGSFVYHPFHLQTVLASAPGVQRLFLWDGVVLMLALYFLIVLVDALRKRLPRTFPWATLALLLAALLGWFLRFGFLSRD